METKVERTYALTRIKAGDYLLPSNDGRTLWRIASYTDGPSSGLDAWPRDRTVWGVWRWKKPLDRLAAWTPDDIDDWNLWESWITTLDTRQEAIGAALGS